MTGFWRGYKYGERGDVSGYMAEKEAMKESDEEESKKRIRRQQDYDYRRKHPRKYEEAKLRSAKAREIEAKNEEKRLKLIKKNKKGSAPGRERGVPVKVRNKGGVSVRRMRS